MMKILKVIFAALAIGIAADVEAQDRPTPQLVAKAKAGDMDAAWALGEMYQNGIGTKVDLQKAMDFYAMAAEPNNWMPEENAKGCYTSLLEQHGEDFRWSDADWAKFDKMYADKGYGWAMHNLGFYHEKQGENEKAVDLYTRAAAKGNIIAAYRLAEALSRGLDLVGGKRDDARAAKYYQQVIDTKLDPEMTRNDLKSAACQRLGGMYRFGRGVAENTARANALLERAEKEFGNANLEEINKQLKIK